MSILFNSNIWHGDYFLLVLCTILLLADCYYLGFLRGDNHKFGQSNKQKKEQWRNGKGNYHRDKILKSTEIVEQ